MAAGHWWDIAIGAGGVVAVAGALWGVGAGLHKITMSWLNRHTQAQIGETVDPVRANLASVASEVKGLRSDFDAHVAANAEQFAGLNGSLARIEQNQVLSHDQLAGLRQDQAVQGTKLDTVLIEVNRLRDRKHAEAQAEHVTALKTAVKRERAKKDAKP